MQIFSCGVMCKYKSTLRGSPSEFIQEEQDGVLEKLHTGATLCNFFLWGYVQTHNEVNLHNSK